LKPSTKKYKNRGFVVLGFPSDDFKQEYSNAEKTAQVCHFNYGVTFPMFAKTSVRGDSANASSKGLPRKPVRSQAGTSSNT
jgi:glutathione peroxidase